MNLLSNPEQHDIEGWAKRAIEISFECERLKAALREALDGWTNTTDSQFTERTERRIAALRAQFLDDK